MKISCRRRSRYIVRTYRIQEVVAVPVPCGEQFGSVALPFGPGIAVREWGVNSEHCNRDGKKSYSSRPTNGRVLLQAEFTESVAYEVKHLAQGHNGEIECWKVMVQKELAGHQIEWEVVEGPAENAHADFIIEALEGDVLVVAEATLPSKYS